MTLGKDIEKCSECGGGGTSEGARMPASAARSCPRCLAWFFLSVVSLPKK